MAVNSTANTLFGKPSKPRATWPKFTNEQRANYERIAVEQRQINDMADARQLVQMYHSKHKDIQREWLQGAFLKILKTSGAAQMEKIRSCMTKVRLTEYENNIT
tara:strand:+ start:148 stop:459 length:312 start_codon:yes stop_codon:yes gene_type:complete